MLTELLNLETLLKKLPERPQNAHKGMFGHVLIVGGDFGMSGACLIAGESALRVGAGLVSLATRPEHALVLNLMRPELMCFGIKTYKDMQQHLVRATVIVLGPGLGRSDWSHDVFNTALNGAQNFVVDADGLNLLALQPQKREGWILTPHPKEAARLLQCTVDEVQGDRLQAAKALQARYGGVTVLKGSGTIVCDDTQNPVSVCPYGNPGMASGGMGDALTGVIAGLIAQGLNLPDAAKLGTCVHGHAGDVAAGTAPRGLLASDLMEPIRKIVNKPG